MKQLKEQIRRLDEQMDRDMQVHVIVLSFVIVSIYIVIRYMTIIPLFE